MSESRSPQMRSLVEAYSPPWLVEYHAERIEVPIVSMHMVLQETWDPEEYMAEIS